MLYYTYASALSRQVPLPSRGVVAPFTNVNGRVWGGTPSLSLRERGQGVWKKKERRNIKVLRLVHFEKLTYSKE